MASPANAITKGMQMSGPNLSYLVPYDRICEPGCYIQNWTGHLMRVPQWGISPCGTPGVNIVGSEPLFCTKISDDPFISLSKARQVASNWDINVNF